MNGECPTWCVRRLVRKPKHRPRAPCRSERGKEVGCEAMQSQTLCSMLRVHEKGAVPRASFARMMVGYAECVCRQRSLLVPESSTSPLTKVGGTHGTIVATNSRVTCCSIAKPNVQACRLMLELLPHACEDPKAHAQESVRSRLWNNWSVHLVAQILRCCSKIA